MKRENWRSYLATTLWIVAGYLLISLIPWNPPPQVGYAILLLVAAYYLDEKERLRKQRQARSAMPDLLKIKSRQER